MFMMRWIEILDVCFLYQIQGVYWRRPDLPNACMTFATQYNLRRTTCTIKYPSAPA